MTDKTRKQRVAEVLADWQAARGSGQHVDPEELLGAHPELADDLGQHLAAMEALDDAFFQTAERELLVPEQIGEYRLLREIGRGGMGIVYEAEQSSMNRRVALKLLSSSITGVKRAVKRFQVEAQAAGRLHHTNIVPVYGMGQHGGYWYYAMELVEGRPLNQLIDELRTEDDAGSSALRREISDSGSGDAGWYRHLAEMFAGVAEALQIAHEEGIVHRDVKPSNLLLDSDGALKIVDFGLAQLEGGGASMTMTGDLLGTPAYMSPEQAMAKRIEVDRRTDVYSLGATLYEILTLRAPFGGRSLQELCSQIITKDPALLRRIDARIPRDLENIVLKAMEKDRDKRYQQAGDLARDLRRFAEGEAVQARRIGPIGRAWRKAKRRKLVTGMAAALVIVALVGGGFALKAARDAKQLRLLDYGRYLVLGQDAIAEREALWASRTREEIEADGKIESLAFEHLTRAIECDSGRPEAYVLRALVPGRPLEERLSDVEAAAARGLAPATSILLRACLRSVFGSPDTRPSPEELEALRATRPRTALGLFAKSRIAKEVDPAATRKARIALLGRAIDEAQRSDITGYLALRSRAWLYERTGEHQAALQDLVRVQALGDRSVQTRVRIAALWGKILGDEDESDEELFAKVLARATASGDVNEWTDVGDGCRQGSRADWLEHTATLACAAYPQSAELRRRLGHDMLGIAARQREQVAKTGCLEAALDLFADAQRLAPDSIEAIKWKTISLLRLGRKADAVPVCDERLALEPNHAPTLRLQGILLDGLGLYIKAEEAFAKLIEADPESADAHAYRAAALLRIGKRNIALQESKQAVDLDPRNPFAQNVLGEAYLSFKQYADALRAFNSAIEYRGPRVMMMGYWLGILRNRGRTKALLGSYSDAVEDYEEVLEKDPKHHLALDELAETEARRGNFGRAIEVTKQALVHYAGDARLHIRHGQILLALEKYSEALEALEQAIELDKDDVSAAHLHFYQGQAHRGLGNTDAALIAYDQTLELNPNYRNALHGRGAILGNQGENEKALRDFERARQLDPKNEVIHNNLLLILKRLKESDKLRSELERWTVLRKNDARAWNGLAWFYVDPDGKPEQRDIKKGLDAAKRAVKLSESKNPAILDTLAWAQFQSGDIDDALDTEQMALSLLSPDSKDRAGYEQALARFRAAEKR